MDTDNFYNQENNEYSEQNVIPETNSGNEALNQTDNLFESRRKNLENMLGKMRKIGSICIDVFLVIVLFFLASNFAFSLVFKVTVIAGKSMQPNINAEITSTSLSDPYNEYAVYKSDEEITRGDVIIYKHESDNVIKRVIALGGDRIKIDLDHETNEYKVFLNGEVLDEPYLADGYDDMKQDCASFNALKKNDSFKMWFDEDGYLVLPNNYIFYLGDNREISYDCASYGPQETQNILGKVVFVVDPYTKNDSLIMLFTKVKILYGTLLNDLEPNF